MEKLLNLVKAMNELSNEIDPNYGKIALFMKEKVEGTDTPATVRYFIQKRPVMGTDGIEVWKYVARHEK